MFVCVCVVLYYYRYGLYGTPLDPELFDMDPPSTCKVANITPTSYATILNGSAPGSNNQPTVTSVPQSEESDFKDLQSLTAATSTDKAASTTTTSTKSLTESIAGHVHGLLEVEPLHFTCHSTSDGSRMECVDPGMMKCLKCRNYIFSHYSSFPQV